MHLTLFIPSKIEKDFFMQHWMEKENVSVIQCGIGGRGVLETILPYFSNNKPDMALLIGICGSYGTFNVGDIVRIDSEAFADQGIYNKENFHPVETIDTNKDIKIKRLSPILGSLRFFNELPSAHGSTVNLIYREKDYLQKLNKYWHSDIQNMEGAYFTSICNTFNIPSYQIRAISNRVNESNAKEWPIEECMKKLARLIQEETKTIQL